ncbi:MAG: tyrosine--tRNA ligase [Candidatus Yanofskybacteria bacterium RIFCSPHIGHO2_02_FULL_50_12]|uniref:Tyrosine--tRNA ligase n=1 Tax=Candidatus Yanofskybacteria bacterium RIFCSPHIGHO2_02_FULL_50_12 TaxID=1802685 RepID=A0A1F8FTI1_9BACT|nr:MAG: tyrosine--tRNA ligase [Candidatus Yanofskybacteria bacterium RIFCSPHIGHO2_02_FULL_50_12]
MEELLTRRIGQFEGRPNIWPSKEEARKRIKEEKSLRVYLGIDPTGPDLHLGHIIPLLFLKQLSDVKHRPVLVIGDFTAQIGDPTGKSETRKPLSKEDVKKNMETYLEQVYKVLPKGSFDVEYNSTWLSKMTVGKFLQAVSNVSALELMTRSMFKERQDKGAFLGVPEFLYPLMQGYDSVAMEIDGEVGGNDQTFNMLMGRDLERKLLGKEKLVFATKLLVGAGGKKMSKSEGEIIAVSDEPAEIRRKVLAFDDGMLREVAELCTEKPSSWIDAHHGTGETPKDPRAFKEDLADEFVRMFHGENALGESRKEKEVSGAGQTVTTVIAGILSSKSEAKSLLDQGAIEVNGVIVKEWNHEVKSGDKIQVGKGKFLKVK